MNGVKAYIGRVADQVVAQTKKKNNENFWRQVLELKFSKTLDNKFDIINRTLINAAGKEVKILTYY